MQSATLQATKRHLLIGFIGWFLVVFVAAAIGGAASADAGSFYKQLILPRWAPPAWLFAPVWSVLYLLIVISAWLVWRVHGFRDARKAIILFIVQLAANALWTWLFFAWRQGGIAFVEILVLLALIIATGMSFWRLHVRAAAILLFPYMAWVTFAAFLNYSVWQLNPDVLG